MDIQNPAHQEVMRLEGIQQKWMPPRQEGYAVVSKALHAAVSKRHFSSSTGSRDQWFSHVAEVVSGAFAAFTSCLEWCPKLQFKANCWSGRSQLLQKVMLHELSHLVSSSV